MNYEECWFEYKSLPQHSYLGRDQEIREKKPRKARIAALFGATLNEAMEEESMITTFRAIYEDENTNRRKARNSKFDVRSSESDSE